MGGNCCAERHQNKDGLVRFAGLDLSMPTFDNIQKACKQNNVKLPSQRILETQKEQMIFMIINLLRVKPMIFSAHLGNFAIQSFPGGKEKNYAFTEDNINKLKIYLINKKHAKPLSLSHDLTQLCILSKNYYTLFDAVEAAKLNCLQSESSMYYSICSDRDDNGNQTQEESFYSANIHTPKNAPLTPQTPKITMQILNRVNIEETKELVVDFRGWEQFMESTLKEFMEIFISSLIQHQDFHSELLNDKYNSIGISLQFNENQDTATLRILLERKKYYQGFRFDKDQLKINGSEENLDEGDVSD